jgi:RNA polymerase subunit RPABC4/transcription elongation factor Spt4
LHCSNCGSIINDDSESCKFCKKTIIPSQTVEISSKAEAELIQHFGLRGENLVRENIGEKTIKVKLKGAFGEGLVITDKRLYVFKWGLMAGNLVGGRCNAFEFGNITGLEIKKNWTSGTFEVLTPATQNSQKSYWGRGNNDAVRSDNIVTFNSRKQFDLFSKAVRIGRDMISKYHSGTNQSDNYILELEKLAELKEKGIVSEEEFQAKKKQILGL